MKSSVEEKLKEAGIAPTPIRILVYKCLENSSQPLSLADIEYSLDTVDKSTVSRTLNIFKENHLVHAFNDGSGSVKYELCLSLNNSPHTDKHVHFHCETCGETICFTNISIPEVALPEGFQAHDANYVISGICAKCSN